MSGNHVRLTPRPQHSKLALILDKIIEAASHAKPGLGFSIAVNGKIEQVYL